MKLGPSNRREGRQDGVLYVVRDRWSYAGGVQRKNFKAEETCQPNRT